MRRGDGAKSAVAPAVTMVLDGQQREEVAREKRGRARGRQSASGIGEDVIARLTVAAQVNGQQSALLSRLVSRDPTKKARPSVEGPARIREEEEARDLATSASLDGLFGTTEDRAVRRRQRHDDRLTLPISVDVFDKKYAINDPMLHYLIDVIHNGKSVTRAEIPRLPERLSDTAQRLALPEEDVLFLAYHRHPPCSFRNVYWLEFISEDRAIDVEFEYFALSHHGITHYRGSSVIDFVDVDSWVTEKRAFDHMTAMRGLQKLQGLLFFMSWKRKAIQIKHRRVRDRIACSLFQCDVVAARLLVAVRECCVKIELLATSYHLAHGATYLMDHIQQHNRLRLKSIHREVTLQHDRMCQLIEREILLLQRQCDGEREAEMQNYACVTRSSRLLDRLYVFLRLVDLHLFEARSAHMSEFVMDLHAQICGDEPSEEGSHWQPHQTHPGVESSHLSSTISIPLPAVSGGPTVPYRTHFSLRHRAIPTPFVFARIIDNVSLVSSFSDIQVSVSPTQSEVFDLVYQFLNGYVTVLDDVPQLLSNRKFHWVLAPYSPQDREKFMATLLKPSTQVLQDHTKRLKQMRYGIETYYKQLEIHTYDLLRLAGDIYAAKDNQVKTKLWNEQSNGVPPDLLSAVQYEEARDVWRSLLLEVQQHPRFAQIGVFLLDQSSLLHRFEGHVIQHTRLMMEELPRVYKQLLCDLLADAENRIERIMNIPTTIPDAIQWLKDMIELMPTQAFRKGFDAKRADLVRLKQLLKEMGASFTSAEEQEIVKRRYNEWDSMYETLTTCFVRIQERDGEYRRSVLELRANADEVTAAQLDQIKHDFSQLPSHLDELNLSKNQSRDLAQRKKSLIDRLERLVTVNGESEEMAGLYSAFEIEHRLFTEQHMFESTEGLHSTPKWSNKSPSEQLLQHVSTVFDVRSWFGAWIALENKWLDTPLISTHPSLVLSRLKQFRRRLQFATTRLLPLSATRSDEDRFVERDYGLVQDLQARVDQLSNNYVILHAATCGTFSADKWLLCQGMLGMESVNYSSITLRMVNATFVSAPRAVEEFKELCGIVVIESKLRSAAERLQQRMKGCRVVLWTTSTFVLIENIQQAILELDDIEVEAKLLGQALNPGFEDALALHDEIHARLMLCSQLRNFQSMWDELCRLSRVHDVEEFFTGQVAWKGPVQRQKRKVGREESTWGDFIQVAEDWTERLRRLVCIGQSSLPPATTQPKSHADTQTSSSKVVCSVGDAQEAFRGFDFDLGIAKCELAHQLLDKYLDGVREKCPRLYLMSKQQLIECMVHDDDITTIRRALFICFPNVTSFSITRGRKEVDTEVELSRRTAGESMGSVTIRGIAGGLIAQEFSVPVVKVGRLRFWLTRLEEEMGRLVTDNAKHAVTSAWRWAEGASDLIGASYHQDQLLQSLHLALSLRFTSMVRTALWPSDKVLALFNDGDLISSCARLSDLHTKLLHDVVDYASSAGDHGRNDARLESMILQQHYHAEVVQRINASIQEGRTTDAEFVWESQLKVDFMVEDLTAKTARRVRVCDRQSWTDWAMLGSAFLVTFLAASGQSEFCIGREMVGICRIPIITPLTERCFFKLMQALRSQQMPLISPVNMHGRGGQGTIIRTVAQMLMRPLREISCSVPATIGYESLTGMLKSVASMGLFLSLCRVDELATPTFRVVLAKIHHLRHDIPRGILHGLSTNAEQRASIIPAPTGCIFVPLDAGTGNRTTQELLFESTTDTFYPVAVVLPDVAHFTKVTALLAGYKLEETANFHPAVTFFESLAHMAPALRQTSSLIYRLIISTMRDILQLRSSCRVLLPSTAKWSSKYPAAASRQRGQRKMSNFFRRSADALDVSDVVIQTLFCHALTVRHKAFLGMAITSGLDLSHQVVELIKQCFPCGNGCELTPRGTNTQEQLWEAVEMSLAQADMIPNTAVMEKVLAMSDHLQTSLAVVVVGVPGVGKSVCIRTLHIALQALEEADLTSEHSSERTSERATSQLVFMSSRFLYSNGYVPDERTKRLLEDHLKPDSSAGRRWLCIDGAIDPARAEAFVRSHVGREAQFTCDSIIPVSKSRIILETTSLEHSSPTFCVQTRILHIPHLLDPSDLLESWRENWIKRLPFPEESRAFENVQLVLRITELLIRGPVRQFAVGEEAMASLSAGVGNVELSSSALPTHLGMLSMSHLTHSCLQLIASACFAYHPQLEERSAPQMIRLVGFCVVWGFAGHLNEQYRQKLDQLLYPVLKQLGETRHTTDPLEGLYESERLGSGFWESIQLPLRGETPHGTDTKNQDKSFISCVVVDSKLSNRILVLSNTTLSLFRVLRLLVHSTTSFIVVGARGTGKSSLLRLLWAMNVEDQVAEMQVDASLNHCFTPEALNWLDKPRTWFNRPVTSPSTTLQHRPKANDEAKLFATFKSGAASFVFIDDVSMQKTSSSESCVDLDPMDEFVRIALAHRMGINWTIDRILPLSKVFAASMTARQAGVPKLRVPHHRERLLRHFCVFKMPASNRQHLQGVFRQVYADWFAPTVDSKAVSNRERVLSLSEVVLRASVDLAVDVLTIQQTTERLELIEGFAFNLHHLNELLRRSFSFIQTMATANCSSTDSSGGATLLSLGKLHQCWVSSARQVFVSPCCHRSPELVAAEIPAVGAMDEMKKVCQSVTVVGEKYFSVPPREDPQAAVVAEIVYGVYRQLIANAATSNVSRVKLGELLTANASASSSSGARRDGISEGGGTIMARDELSVQVARELMFENATDLLRDKIDSPVESAGLASRLGVRLHLGSLTGLHELLYILQSIAFSSGILIDQPLGPVQESVFRLAFAIEKYELIELNAAPISCETSIQSKLEEALLSAGTAGKRVALWIDLDEDDNGQIIIDTIVATCSGKVPPLFYESEKLRGMAVASCVQTQRSIQLLSADDAVVHFQDMLRQHLRLCVVAQQGNPPWLMELMRGSAAFQWISFCKGDTNNPRYRSEVICRAIRELTGHAHTPFSRGGETLTTRDICQVASWTSLHSLCDSLFDAKRQRWNENLFLMFVGNVVADCTHRVEATDKEINEHARLSQALHDIHERTPRLQVQSKDLTTRIHQLSAWQDELRGPFADLMAQLRDRVEFLHEKEPELASDELRVLQRQVHKLEMQAWAHRSMMEEYDLARTEVANQRWEVDAELGHWAKHSTARVSIGTRVSAQLTELQLLRDTPEKLLQASVKAYSHILESPYHNLTQECDIRDTDSLDHIVSLLWRARFTFLRHDTRAQEILSAIDTLHAQIPLVVDPSSFFQHILIHVFSYVPWFSDGKDECDRRDAVGFTACGAVAPMIIQCDGGPKMWRKLHEAVQKEVPTLLVGVSEDLIAPLSRFAKQHMQHQYTRQRLLRELTLDAYRLQLKRDASQSKPMALNSQLVGSVLASQESDEKSSRRYGIVSGDFKTISASLASAGATRRGSRLQSDTIPSRRSSHASAVVVPLKGIGFQMYAVTHHAIDRRILDTTSHFARFQVDWHPHSVEAFFTESAIRRHSKKTHKDLVDARRVEVDSAYHIALAEEAVWSIVRSPTCTSPSEREAFMVRLNELAMELERHHTRKPKAHARLAVLESRLKEYEIVGRDVVCVIRAAREFARAVSPLNTSIHVRSYRFFEQLLETTITSLMKQDQDSGRQESRNDFVSRLSRHVRDLLVSSVMSGIASASHQRIFLLVLADVISNGDVTPTTMDTASQRALTWLLWRGSHDWASPTQLVAPAKECTPNDTKDAGQVSEVDASSVGLTEISASPVSSGLSLAERLRCKVRACSLIIEHIEAARNKSLLEEKEAVARSGKRLSTLQTSVETYRDDPTGPIDDALKTFRGVTRTVKTLWCEWKLSKEDSNADASRALASLQKNQPSRVIPTGLHRRYHSIADMTFTSTNVVRVITLGEVVAHYIGSDGDPSESEARTLEGQLAVVMLAKAYFPQHLLREWDKCLKTVDSPTSCVVLSTSQLLGLDDSIQRRGSTQDRGSSEATSFNKALATQQLPPFIDVAWRRDDLVHLPTRVLLYDPSSDRTTVDVLFLRARDPAQPSPLRLLSIAAWDESDVRLGEQLTASIGSKERFAVEISHEDHFNRVVALVSGTINQHALLCVPEWYLVTTTQIFQRLQSPVMGYLRVHAVKMVTEANETSLQLAQWLISTAGLAEADARTAARVLLYQAITQSDGTEPAKPLTVATDMLVAKLKMIAQSGEPAARQGHMKHLLLRELELETEEKLALRAVKTRDDSVRETKASLEFLADLLLLRSHPKAFSSFAPSNAPSTEEPMDQGVSSPAISEVSDQLELICEQLCQDVGLAFVDGSEHDVAKQRWRLLMRDEQPRTVCRLRALLQLLKIETTLEVSQRRTQECALVHHGFVPVDWLATHFPMLSDVCLSNVVSVAQVLVLLASRLGLLLYSMSGSVPWTLNLSLLDDPRTLLRRIHEDYVGHNGCDPSDVVFVLQPGVTQTDATDSNEGVTANAAAETSANPGGLRRRSQSFPRGLEPVGPPHSSAAINKPATLSSCLVIGDDGVLCGLQLDGLAAVERVIPINGGGVTQVFIHEVPVCRLVCQQRRVDATQRTIVGDKGSSKRLTTENATTTKLKHGGARLTTIVSTTAFQTLPDSFWVAPENEESDPETLLPRILFSPSMLASMASLSRTRPENDSASIVLAVPVFPTDDNDQDL